MHEYSIVNALIDLCEEHVEKNKASKVISLKVAIGSLSGVEADLLLSSYDTFKEGTVCEDAIMDVQRIEPEAICLTCEEEFGVDEYNFLCPKCGSGQTKLIKGKEMHLMSLELE
ncbi:MAG: hydrogenase maturation nickel metallochaperone HypA [Campylobacterales bacterium]